MREPVSSAAPRPDAVAIQSPHGYVSPAWYPSEGLVPTWNYVAVHVHGTLRRLDDPGEVEAILTQQIATFEGDLPAWRPDRATLLHKLQGITAFRLDVEHIDAKLKLGQNRKLQDRVAARTALEAAPRQSDRELAAWMKSTEPDDGPPRLAHQRLFVAASRFFIPGERSWPDSFT